MTRWEYMAVAVDWRPKHDEKIAGVRVDRHDAVETVLEELGRDGWEVSAIDAASSWRLVLKRPVADRPEADPT